MIIILLYVNVQNKLYYIHIHCDFHTYIKYEVIIRLLKYIAVCRQLIVFSLTIYELQFVNLVGKTVLIEFKIEK